MLAETAVALVATPATYQVDPLEGPDRNTVVGILDITIAGEAATIDTIATHPDHQAHGIATALLQRALPMLADRGVATLDAWTREDQAANAWYRRNGFAETFRYVHAYVGGDDDLAGFVTPPGCSQPVTAFVHAPIDQEAQVRERFHRVYVCRQYRRSVILR
ncbi:N-acetyltransferase [Nakamurella sp. UYEF19]|uniref:GNAT family N-acetyltransferase n=1 Tax=Nakamurella sp. UYEF19 TaxID=1756392 RepID=UPI0033994F93